MKMWVSVTSSGEVGNIIKQEHLGIETYTERLVEMFNAIVTRDAQSPHGKFYFVAKRLQERFAQIKEGTTKAETEAREQPQRPVGNPTPRPRSRQSPTNQTPLHLLSEVAMGTGNASTSQPQQPAIQNPQQQHSLSALNPTWYDVSAMNQQQQQQPDIMSLGQETFDAGFDLTQFDFGMGSDADLTALFIPDPAFWNFAPLQPQPGGGYNGGSF